MEMAALLAAHGRACACACARQGHGGGGEVLKGAGFKRAGGTKGGWSVEAFLCRCGSLLWPKCKTLGVLLMLVVVLKVVLVLLL